MRIGKIILGFVMVIGISACSSVVAAPSRTMATMEGAAPSAAPPKHDALATPTVDATGEPLSAQTATSSRALTATFTVQRATAAPTPTFNPDTWQHSPVLPALSPRALNILQDGLARGNNPHAFSKIGDCESQASWFLGEYDGKNHLYALGPYEAQLSPVIPYYQGSFQRVSLAARPGFSAASLMAPIWADKQQCAKDETPLACEYRLQRPLVAFIMLGSNDASNPKTFDGHMRKVIEYSIAQGVLPILGTKADNVEGNHFVNANIARLAYEYDLPLWNFWAAVNPLPDHGLQADGVHLTFAAPFFDDPSAMRRAWPVRNLNALQILKTIMEQTP